MIYINFKSINASLLLKKRKKKRKLHPGKVGKTHFLLMGPTFLQKNLYKAASCTTALLYIYNTLYAYIRLIVLIAAALNIDYILNLPMIYLTCMIMILINGMLALPKYSSSCII